MTRWTCIFGALAAVGLSASGCGEPYEIVTAAPPGVDLRSTIKTKEAEEPVAIGETGAREGATPHSQHTAAAASNVPPALPTAKGEVKTTKSGVKYETLKEGKGAEAKSGERVTVHYVGTLEDGRKFDSSRDRGAPTEFKLAAESVITGWVEGVPGMKVGEVRKLVVPPNAGYGAQGKGPVPPNATITFEIELIGAK